MQCSNTNKGLPVYTGSCNLYLHRPPGDIPQQPIPRKNRNYMNLNSMEMVNANGTVATR